MTLTGFSMNNSSLLRTGLRVCSFAVLLLLLADRGTIAFGANSFVKGFQGVDVVDAKVDNVGTTYLLCQDTNNCRIRKYDSGGAKALWPGSAEYLVIPNLVPVAFCVAPATTNLLYIVGSDGSGNFRILMVNSQSGVVSPGLTGPSTFLPKSITFAGTNSGLYVCGNFNGFFDTDIFGRTAHPRGNPPALVMRLNTNLPGRHAPL